jgi:hypothetical protein
VTEQGGEGGLHPVSAHHRGQVPVLAAGQQEEPSIQVGRLPEDDLSRDLEEAVRAAHEPILERLSGLVVCDRPTQEPRKTREQARPVEGFVRTDQVSRPVGARGRLSRSRR